MEAGAIGDRKQAVSETPASWARGDFSEFFQRKRDMYAEKLRLDDGLYRRSEERLSRGAWGVMMGK